MKRVFLLEQGKLRGHKRHLQQSSLLIPFHTSGPVSLQKAGTGTY